MVHEGILDTYNAQNNYSGDLFLYAWNEMLLRLLGFRNKDLFSLQKESNLKTEASVSSLCNKRYLKLKNV